MDENKILNFGDAAVIIKEAILRSRYQAAKILNKELLSLYYAVGKYVSDNSRGVWGQGAIKQISNDLQKELPGLRGFSEGAIKKMRLFYEEWQPIFVNRSLSMNDLKSSETSVIIYNFEDSIDLSLLSNHINCCKIPNFSSEMFYRTGFTHHYTIMAKEKSLDGRLFYISQCAVNFWSVETLKSNLRGELYSRKGSMPNNFLQTLPEAEQARRAVQAFKDEYFLEYINIEDEIDPEEKVLEREIVANIKQFILSFGNKFCFVGNQYRVMVDDEEFFIDLLFFNRELRCLVAVELKRGAFKPAHLGQLHFYLTALDKYVKQDDEQPSIGILLCKEAKRSIVEIAVSDYSKPMGVATYKTRNELPEEWQKALPDIDDMRKLLETSPDEQDSEVDE